MSVCGENKADSKVILVSCSGMCVHGQISSEAVHNVIYEKAQAKTNWVCPAAIAAKIKWQLNRLKNARAIIAVPGCPAYCDIKLLKDAGFEPTTVIDAHKICDFSKWGMELTDIPLAERKEMVKKLSEAIEQEVAKLY